MAYAELHCRSNFSFLQGASHPHELVQQANQLNLHALAITDLNGVYGIVRAWDTAKQIKQDSEDAHKTTVLYGSELSFVANSSSACQYADAIVLIARNVAGYQQLSQLITKGRLRGEKGACVLTTTDLFQHGGTDKIVLAGGPRSRLFRRICEGAGDAAQRELASLREAFGDTLYIEVTRHKRPGDRERSLAMLRLARALKVQAVATNDVHFHQRPRKQLHDVLTCIRHGCTLNAAGYRLLPNAERCMKSEQQMLQLFADIPDVVHRTAEVAARCDFSLEQLAYRYPPESVPSGESPDIFLARLARKGLTRRLGKTRAQELEQRLTKELAIIAQLGYAGYFLTMWDIVTYCKTSGILCQGRGSAANSLVCYATGITAVSPNQIDMLFERFISLERQEPPDIDLDIEHDRREEVIQYVYDKFGRDHAAMVAEFIRYRQRSAMRDAGKVLGFSERVLSRLTRSHAANRQAAIAQTAMASGVDPQSRSWKLLIQLTELLDNFPRHLSIHVGGFMLSSPPISTIVPFENARMPNRTIIQWDKYDIEALGIFKVDLLGLGMLNMIARAFTIIADKHRIALTLANIPRENSATYEMIQRADTIGVFQIESRAQMNMLPRLKPQNFYDLVIEVALVRPGPIQGGMVHPYLRRRSGKEPVSYPHPKLREILQRTLGVPVFQEQVMRIAIAVGGYSPGEADQLRRDMAAWRHTGNMEQHKKRLWAAMRAAEISGPFAERILQQIDGFGSYGFPESHAASFAHLVYVSAYLKCHYPAEFAAALINAQPMGFYQISSIVADAYRHRVPILAVDVQHSAWETTVVDNPRPAEETYEGADRQPTALRLGLHLVRGLSQSSGHSIVAIRHQSGPFASIANIATRCQLSRKHLVDLAMSGALDSLHSSRREAIWHAHALGGTDLTANALAEPAVQFEELSAAEAIALDYVHAQNFGESHPMHLHRTELAARGVKRATDLVYCRAGTTVTVAGLVLVRQRPGKGNVLFLSLEDETGLIDVTVYLELFAQNRTLILLSPILIVSGTLQLDGQARSILAKRFHALQSNLPVNSRDFH